MKTNVLDHGYVQHVETWGSDERIIESARMSTAKGFIGWGPKEDGSAGDEKLLKYLWDNRHATPFEMAGMTLDIQAPIFVFREWHRHRTQSYSELSARYTPMLDFSYLPTIERIMLNANTTNKQAGTVAGAVPLTEDAAKAFQWMLARQYDVVEREYQGALAAGIPKELARLHLPVARYSRMRASANLRNWLAFLTLRQDAAAQWEIRQFANVVAENVKVSFPQTYRLFVGAA